MFIRDENWVGPRRSGSILVPFRDDTGRIRSVGFYDADLDRRGIGAATRPYAGIVDVVSKRITIDGTVYNNERPYDVGNCDNCTPFHLQQDGPAITWLLRLLDLAPSPNFNDSKQQVEKINEALLVGHMLWGLDRVRGPNHRLVQPLLNRLFAGSSPLEAVYCHPEPQGGMPCPGGFSNAKVRAFFEELAAHVTAADEKGWREGNVLGRAATELKRSEGSYNTFKVQIAAGGVLTAWMRFVDGPDWFDTFIGIFFAIVFTVVGHGIGVLIGFTGAALAAFSAAFGTFVSGILQGKDPLDAFLDALKAGAIAYAASWVLNNMPPDDPNIDIVGVQGSNACPNGVGCFLLKPLNRFLPIRNLARIHDPFIDWSVQAFGDIGGSAWYKAITIPPFLLPGCTSDPTCLVGGIYIVDEREL